MSWNLVTDFSADPSGVGDSTTALQNALSFIGADTFGGQLIIPKGAYRITAQTSYSSSKPLWLYGEGQQASQIRMDSTSTSLGYICIAQGASFGDQSGNEGTVRVSDLGFYNDVTAATFTQTNIGLYLSGVNHGEINNVGFYKGIPGHQINQAIVQNGCNQVRISNCDIWAAVNAVTYEGYCQVNTVEDSHLWMPTTGVSTAAAVLYKGQTLGCAMRHVICHDGDRGVLATQDSNGQTPHLFEFLDVEFNNHTVAHCDFEYGVHASLFGCIFSGAAVNTNVPGLQFGSNWQGDSTIIGCEFIGVPGHSVNVKAGSGYTFDSCNFGGSGSYKFAANSADELQVATSATNVTANGCHFNTNTLLGVGTSMAPRYAINATGGITQADNIFAANSLYSSGSAIH